LFLHVPHPVEDADKNSSDEDAVLFNHSNEDINIFIRNLKHLDDIKHCIVHEEEMAAINQSDRMSSDPPLCNFVLFIFSFH
jgi:hypothetical protein